jgi:N-acetylglucosamine kinase-like BadF-type ATPase
MFLGVDGGGTKTAYALLDADGRLRATHVGASVDHLAAGIDAARGRLAEGLQSTFAEAGVAPADVRFAFVGLPAYGEDRDAIAALDALPDPVLAAGRYRCGNDMVCSWAGSLACQDGISVIAGTGSMAYGEFRGQHARAGGWGELIGDEGSAYWIAREGLNLFSRMSDGRAPRGPLHRLVRERLGIREDLDVCARIYGERADRRGAFAQFARLVHEAAEGGDTAAAGIFARGAQELVGCVAAVRRALDVPPQARVAVSHTGGVFENAPAIVAYFRSALAGDPEPYEYREPRFAPAVGAALYAARAAEAPLSDAAVARLEADCKSRGGLS